MTKFVAYYRVSTKKQEESGLGLAAQEGIVKAYNKLANGKIIASFTEIESGSKDDRPRLLAAIKICRDQGATLVTAKLDRLARSVALITSLQDSGVKFIACDMPEANETMIIVMGAFGQYERKAISNRVKDAMAIVKRDGSKSGKPIGRPRGHVVGEKTRKLISQSKTGSGTILDPLIANTIKAGLEDGELVSSITRNLNRLGVKAPQGGPLHQKQVSRWINRIKLEEIS